MHRAGPCRHHQKAQLSGEVCDEFGRWLRAASLNTRRKTRAFCPMNGGPAAIDPAALARADGQKQAAEEPWK